MTRLAKTFTVLLALAAPLAAASWGDTYEPAPEPSLPEDDPSVMWEDPHVDPNPASERIYLSLVLAPSSAADHDPLFTAILGAWKDCNRDGYVGNLATGSDPYDAALLPDTSVCPPTSSAHHDGATVKELLWIGPWGADIVDPDVRVWADWGRYLDPWPPTHPPKNKATDVLVYQPTATGPRWVGSAVKELNPYPAGYVAATAYAYVGPATVAALGSDALPGGSATYLYGADKCPAVPGPVGPANWSCSYGGLGNWPPPGGSLMTLLHEYQLRDSDCAYLPPGC